MWYEDTEGAKVLLTEETYWTVISLWPWLEMKVEVEWAGRGLGKWAEEMRAKGLIWTQRGEKCWKQAALYSGKRWELGKKQAAILLSAAKKRITSWSTIAYQATNSFPQQFTTQIKAQKRKFASLMTLLTALCVFSLAAYTLPMQTLEPRLLDLVHFHLSNETEALCLLVPQCNATYPLTYKQEIYSESVFLGEEMEGFLLNLKQDSIKIGKFDAYNRLQGDGVLIGSDQVAIGYFHNDHLSHGRLILLRQNRILEGSFRAGAIAEGSEAIYYPQKVNIWKEVKWSTDVLSLYTGKWANGVYDGTGELKNSQFTYYGDFLAGEGTGKGLLRTVSGEVHSGSFRNGKLEGFGCVFKAATEICGQFSSGSCNGKAIRSNSEKVEMVTCDGRREKKTSWW